MEKKYIAESQSWRPTTNTVPDECYSAQISLNCQLQFPSLKQNLMAAVKEHWPRVMLSRFLRRLCLLSQFVIEPPSYRKTGCILSRVNGLTVLDSFFSLFFYSF